MTHNEVEERMNALGWEPRMLLGDHRWWYRGEILVKTGGGYGPVSIHVGREMVFMCVMSRYDIKFFDSALALVEQNVAATNASKT